MTFMKFVPISAKYKTSEFRIHKILGLLLEFVNQERTKVDLPNKIKSQYLIVANPYLLRSNTQSESLNEYSDPPVYAHYLAKIYTFLCLRSFIFVRLLSQSHFPIFNTAEEAILFYQKLYPKQQQNLCLPRSLFAACTSKSFKNSGALFIGVFLPSKAMHAWIMEEEKQPDIYDDIWICYQPVAVMYKE